MRLCYYLSSPESWLRIGRFVLVWKSPAMRPGFSERFGYVRTLFRVRGYRLILEVE